MPELPEVETIRRDLSAKIAGKKIKAVKILDKKLGQSGKLARFLVGEVITEVDRIGKLLIFKLSGNNFLLIHLKMTGQLVYLDGDKIIAGGHPFKKGSVLEKIGGLLPNKHTRLFINFNARKDDQGILYFNDLRRFGYVKVVSGEELELIKNNYGIEPLKKEFTLESLEKILAKRNISIKAVLLDQKKISGIGNIYADEILFASGIKPWRKASSVKDKEIKKIHQKAQKIIALAIENRGTTFSDYVDAQGKSGGFAKFLKVYGRDGEKCLKCGGKIEKRKVSGRGTHFCNNCQI